MGAKAVSILQIHQEDMKAHLKVQMEPRDPVVDIDDPYMNLSIMTVDPDAETREEVPPGEASPKLEDPDGESAAGLRKRNVTEKEGKDTDDEKIDELSSRVEELGIKKGQGSPKKHDPLKWFGVLVPQSLRVAQSQFKLAAELSCDAASLKAKLVHLQGTIRRLLRRKEDIIDSIDNSGFVIYDDSSFSTTANFTDSTIADVSVST